MPLDPKQAVSQANLVRLVSPSGDEFAVELKPQAFAGEYAVFAYGLCRKQAACIVRGWTDRQAIPAAFPVTERALRSLTFPVPQGCRHQGGAGAVELPTGASRRPGAMHSGQRQRKGRQARESDYSSISLRVK